MADLAAFLRAALAEPFDWDRINCGLWACEWIVEVRGFDPAVGWRDRPLRGEAEWLAAINAEGGMQAVARRTFASFGLVEAERPKRGDVVCVNALGREILGVFTGNGKSAMRAVSGLIVAPAPVLTAWAMGYVE